MSEQGFSVTYKQWSDLKAENARLREAVDEAMAAGYGQGVIATEARIIRRVDELSALIRRAAASQTPSMAMPARGIMIPAALPIAPA